VSSCSLHFTPTKQPLGWQVGYAYPWQYFNPLLMTPPLFLYTPLTGKLVMGAGIIWFSLASILLPALAITPATIAAGLVLPAVLASRFLVGVGEGVALPAMNSVVASQVSGRGGEFFFSLWGGGE
jgi:hypothetical protein